MGGEHASFTEPLMQKSEVGGQGVFMKQKESPGS